MTMSAEHVMAERLLRFEDPSSSPKTVRVLVGKPVKSGETEYLCETQILGLGDDKARPIYGIDSMQALQLALRFISEMLDHYRANLTWLGSRDIGI
jgi:hypothetical protein